jgi:phage-related protein
MMILCQPTVLETLQNVLELVALSLQKRTMFLDRDLQQTAHMHTTELNEGSISTILASLQEHASHKQSLWSTPYMQK